MIELRASRTKLSAACRTFRKALVLAASLGIAPGLVHGQPSCIPWHANLVNGGWSLAQADGYTGQEAADFTVLHMNRTASLHTYGPCTGKPTRFYTPASIRSATRGYTEQWGWTDRDTNGNASNTCRTSLVEGEWIELEQKTCSPLVCPADHRLNAEGTVCSPDDKTIATRSPQQCTEAVGHPIYPLTGAKKKRIETGLALAGWPLVLLYDTTDKTPGDALTLAERNAFGALWRTSFHHKLTLPSGARSAQLSRGDGVVLSFANDGAGNFTAAAGMPYELITRPTGYLFIDRDTGILETYDLSGRLILLTMPDGKTIGFGYSGEQLNLAEAQDGRSIQFAYDGSGYITSITATGQQPITASYDANRNLTGLTWQDGRTLGLVYENGDLPWALTGLVDEGGNRLETYSYNADGLAIHTERAGGADSFTVSYGTAPQRVSSSVYDSARQVWRTSTAWQAPTGVSITQPNGQVVSMESQTVNGMPSLTSRSQPAASGCSAATSSRTYDARGNILSEDDFSGRRTCHAYDSRNREVARIEGLATNISCADMLATGAVLPTGARRVTTSWHPDWRLPVVVTEPLRKTVTVYHGQPDPFNSNATASCTSAPVRADGKPVPLVCKQVVQVLSDDGSVDPSVPVSTTRFTYTDLGRLLSVVDPNGRTTSYTYYSDAIFGGDVYWANVVALVHGNGANGSTSFVDSSASPKALGAIGSGTTISTANSKFGGASIRLTGSGAVRGTSSDWSFAPSDDYTVEFWFNRTGGAGNTAGMVTLGGNPRWAFFYRYSNRVAVYSATSGTFMQGATNLSMNTWYHYALTKQGSTFRLFLNGALDASATVANASSAPGSIQMDIGDNTLSGEYFNGYIDEVRITKGVARYISNFTPSEQPFPEAGVTPASLGHMVGDLKSISNSKGQVTHFTQYDRAGRLRQIVDAKGIVTDLTYTPRGKVSNATQTPPGGSGRVTAYSYDDSGRLAQVDEPDGSHLTYSYDAAHRLTGIADARGNSITYTLDASGNRIGEDIKDAGGVLRRSIARSFDALNRVQQVTGAAE